MTSKEIVDYLNRKAQERNCGFILDRGFPKLKHYSQDPEFYSIEEAIEAATITEEDIAKATDAMAGKMLAEREKS